MFKLKLPISAQVYHFILIGVSCVLTKIKSTKDEIKKERPRQIFAVVKTALSVNFFLKKPLIMAEHNGSKTKTRLNITIEYLLLSNILELKIFWTSFSK